MGGRRVAVGGVCKRDCGQLYNTVVNTQDHCMACQGEILLAGYDPVGRVWMPCAESLSDLPPHEIAEEDVDAAGQRYARLRYADGSEGLIDPIPLGMTRFRLLLAATANGHLIPLRRQPRLADETARLVPFTGPGCRRLSVAPRAR